MYSPLFKPFLDFTISFLSLILLSPLFVAIILIQLFTVGKPFFLQKRLGKNERLFNIIKFRSMNDERDVAGNLLLDNLRTTAFGRFLRRSSLDELPQLINVIKGDMALIGPRPMLPFYTDLYNDFQMRRNEVKPGITGLAQVKGRNAVSWFSRFRFDVWYVNHLNFCLDMYILGLTFLQLFNPSDVEYSENIPTEFEGNP